MPVTPEEIDFILFNLDNGRRVDQVVREVQRARRQYNPDLILCQEGRRYRRALGPALPRYQTMGANHSPQARDTYILAHRDLKPRWFQAAHDMDVTWSRRPSRGGQHPARVFTVHQMGWLDKVANIHMAPKQVRDADAAWDEQFQLLRWLTYHWNRQGFLWMIAGDWNALPRRDADVEKMMDDRGATPYGWGIDWAMLGPGVEPATEFRKVDPRWTRGDHPLSIGSIKKAPL